MNQIKSIKFILLLTTMVALHCHVYWSPWYYTWVVGQHLPEPKGPMLFIIWATEILTIYLLTDDKNPHNQRLLQWEDVIVFCGGQLMLFSLLWCLGFFGVPESMVRYRC